MAAQQGIATSVYPWSAVVHVEAVFPNGFLVYGSGVMVGRNDVLTAAHMVYEPAWGGLAASVTVVPGFVPELGRNGPFGSSPAYITAADTGYNPSGDAFIVPGNRGPGLAGSERDVAFLSLPAPLGDKTGWMELDPTFRGGYANLSGYPDAYGFHLTNDVQYAPTDPVDAFINLYWFEAHPGASGGPVWHYGPDGNPAVVGLVSSGLNGRGGAAYEIATSYDLILGWIASNDYLIA